MSQDEPYEVKWCEELGRYLIASRDIESREIIIREEPLVSGPTDRGPKDIPVCLGCCGVMYENPFNRCTNCHWPVCNEVCEKLPSHALNECQIFHKNRVLYPPPYGWPYISKSIVILRCLLFKTQNPSNWSLLMDLSNNKEIREGKPNCINSDKRILQNFAKFMPAHDGSGKNAASANEGFSEEEVTRISGIIDTNAHAFPLSINGISTFVCNLYSKKVFLLAHCCHPNSSWSPDKSLSDKTLTVRANVPIAKGDMISVAYDDSQILVCTLKRVIPNEINGMFVCRCKRCTDPTEFGTYIGALKCPSCEKGYLLPIDPVDSFSSWKCDNDGSKKKSIEDNNNDRKRSSSNCGLATGERHLPLLQDSDADRKANSEEDGETGEEEESGNCNEVLDDESIMEIIEEAESLCGYTKLNLGPGEPPPSSSHSSEEQEREDERLELLKEFVRDYSGKILHPNHYILQEVSVRILKGDYAKGLSSLSDSDLIQYLERCEWLLGIADVLTPGFCEYRAFLQFHFSQGLLSLERRKEEKEELKKQQYNNNRGKDETWRNDDGDDDDDDGSKLKHESTDDDHHALDRNASDVTSPKNTIKEELEEGENHFEKYGNSENNLNRLVEMLTFLLAFFKEINPGHKLLEPISETLEDTKIRLEEEFKMTRKESK